MRSGTPSTDCAPTAAAARSRASNLSRTRASAATPVTASMRRIPEPMLRSPVIRKPPIWPLARACVPPHSSKLKSWTRMVRTVSPYFSSKKASAPPSIASAMLMNATGDGPVLADDAMDLVLDRVELGIGQAAVEREVEAQVVRSDQRSGLACPLPDDVPQRPMQQMRGRVVAHRARAPVRVDDRLDRRPDLESPVKRRRDGRSGHRPASGCR